MKAYVVLGSGFCLKVDNGAGTQRLRGPFSVPSHTIFPYDFGQIATTSALCSLHLERVQTRSFLEG